MHTQELSSTQPACPYYAAIDGQRNMMLPWQPGDGALISSCKHTQQGHSSCSPMQMCTPEWKAAAMPLLLTYGTEEQRCSHRIQLGARPAIK